jgi:hypothetical protein
MDESKNDRSTLTTVALVCVSAVALIAIASLVVWTVGRRTSSPISDAETEPEPEKLPREGVNHGKNESQAPS